MVKNSPSKNRKHKSTGRKAVKPPVMDRSICGALIVSGLVATSLPAWSAVTTIGNDAAGGSYTTGTNLTLAGAAYESDLNAGAGNTFNALNFTGTTAQTLQIDSKLTLTSSGSNSITVAAATGSLAITGGTLTTGATANALTLSVTNSGGSASVASIISGAGGLTVPGAGTVTLTGSNTFTGATTISSGTLILNSATGLALSGTSLTLNGGTVQLNRSNQIFSSGSVQVAGGTLAMQTFSNTVAGVQLIGGGSITGSGILTSANAFDMQSGTVSVNLAGSVGLNKSTANTVTLTGSSSYTGVTTVSAGTLILNNAAGAAISGSAVSINTGGTVQLNQNNQIASSGSVQVAGGTLAVQTFNDTVAGVQLAGGSITGSGVLKSANAFDMQSGTVSANLAGTVGSVGLNKSGTGTVTLTGSSSYTGATTVSAGTLILNSAAAPAISGTVVTINTGGTVQLAQNNQIASSGSVQVAGGTLAMQTFNDTVTGVQLTNNGSITGSGTLTSANAFDMQSGTVAANLSGTVNLNKTGAGTVTLSGTGNSLNGINLDGGTLALGGLTVLQNGATIANTGAGLVTLSGTLTQGGAGIIGNSAGSSGTATVTGVWNTGAGLLVGNTGAGVLNLTGGAVTVGGGTGTLTLAANAGSVGTLNVGSGAATGTLSAGTVFGGAGTAAVNFNNTGAYTFTPGLTGTLNVSKVGVGSMTLTGSSSYAGATTVSAGTLILSSTSGPAISGSVVTINTGGTVQLNQNNQIASSDSVQVAGGTLAMQTFNDAVAGVQLAGGSITGSGTLTSANAFDLQNGTVAASLSGTVGLNKSTANTVTLTGANSYTGPTAVTAGTLVLGSTNGLTVSGSLLSVNGGTVRLNQSNQILSSGSVQLNNGTLQMQGFNNTVAGVQLAGGGSIAGTGGTLTSTGGFDLQAGTASANLAGGSLNKSGVGTVTLSGTANNASAINVDGGTLSLTGSTYVQNNVMVGNTAAGILTLNGATAVLTAGGRGVIGNGALANGTVTVSNGGVWSMGADLAVGQNGAGVLNINSGGLVSSSSTVSIGSAVGASGTVALNSGTLAAAGLYVGNSGLGLLRLDNGSLVSSTSAAYIGAAAGSVGTVAVNSGTLAAGSLYVGNSGSGTLTITGTSSAVTVGGQAFIGGAAGSNGSMTVNGGALSLGSDLVVAQSGTGTLTLTNAGVITSGSTLYLGTGVGSSGTAAITGGTLNSAAMVVGSSGTGAVTVTGSGGLIVGSGSGTVILAQNAGSVGTLTIASANGSTGAFNAGVISGGAGTATLYLNANDNPTLKSNLTGSLTVNKQGNGVTMLTGSNSYTGTTTVSNGTLALSSTTGPTVSGSLLTIGSAGTVRVNQNNQTVASGSIQVAGGWLQFNGNYSTTVAGVQLTGNGQIAGSGTLGATSNFDLQYGSVNASLVGAANINKSGTNGVTLFGVANNVNGLTVDGGRLDMFGSTALQSDAIVGNSGSATLTINSSNGTLTGVGSGIIGNNLGASGTVSVTGGASWGLGSDLIVGGSGKGTLTISGTDATYGTASAVIGGGKAIIGNSQGSSGSVTVSTGTLSVASNLVVGQSGSGSLIISNGGTVFTASSGYIGAGAGSSGTVGVVTGMLNVGNTLYVGSSGTGVLSLMSTGIVQVAGGVGTVVVAANAGSVGTVNLGGVDGYINAFNVGTVTGGSGTAVLNVYNNGNYTAPTLMGSLALSVSGAGVTTLSGSNSFTGNTTISSGTLLFGSPTALQKSTLFYTSASGLLDFGSQTAVTLGGLTSGTTGTPAGLTMTNDGGGAVALTVGGNNQSTTYSGAINSLSSLTKTGTGTLTLSSANSFDGGATVNGGTLAITGSFASGNNVIVGNIGSGAVTVTGNGVLNVGNGFQPVTLAQNLGSVGQLTLGGSGAATGTLFASSVSGGAGTASVIFANAGSYDWTTPLGGSLSVNMQGAGTTVFTTANTNTGSTTVSNGTLVLSAAGGAAVSGSLIVSGGIALWNQNDQIVSSGGLQVTSGTAMMQGFSNTVANVQLTGGAILGSGVLTSLGNFDLQSGTVSTSLSGTAANLTKSGTGTVLLSGVSNSADVLNVFGGTLALSGSTYVQNNVVVSSTTGAVLNIGTGGILTTGSGAVLGNRVGSSGTATISSLSLWRSGGGIVVGNTGSGTLTVSGNLFTGGADVIGSAAGSVGNVNVVGGMWNSPVGLTVGLSGTGVLNVNGGGSVTVAGSNGTLLLAQNPGSVATLNVGGTDGSAGTLNVRAITSGLGTAQVNLSTTGTAPIPSLAGSNLSLNVNSIGTTPISGTNTFSGNTVISGGTLALQSSVALENSTLNYNNQGGTLSFGSLTTVTLGNLAGGQNLALTNTAGGAVTLDVGNNNGNAIYSGALSGSGSLIKIGTGSLTLVGNNTNTGLTDVQGGSLMLSSSSGPAIAGDLHIGSALVLLNSSNQIATTSSVTVQSGILAMESGSNAVAAVHLLGGAIFGPGALVSASDFDLQSGNVSASLSGSVGLGKTTNGTVTLAGSNSFTGSATVSAGTLVLDSTNGSAISGSNLVILTSGSVRLNQSNQIATSGSIQVAGGTLAMQAFNNTVSGLQLAGGSITGSGILTSTQDFDLQAGSAATVLGGNVGVVKSGSGTVTLSGANIFTGDTVINSGTLALSSSLALQKSFLNYNSQGGVVSFGSLATVVLGGLKGSQDLALSNSGGTAVNLMVAETNGGAVSSGTYTGTLSGPGALTKNGLGTLTLTGNNTNTGLTDVQGGVLVLNATGGPAIAGDLKVSGGVAQLGLDNQLGAASSVTVQSGTLAMQGFSNAVGAVHLTGGDITGSGTLTSSSAFDLQSGNVLASLSGTAGVVKTNTAGTVTFSASNSYTGATVNNGGILAIAAGSAGTFGNGTGSLMLNGADAIASLAVVDLGQTVQKVGSVQITNGFVKGGTLISNSGYTTSGLAEQNPDAVFSGAGGLTVLSGTTNLTGNNSYTGLTAVRGGMLQLGATGGPAIAGNLQISGGGIAQLQQNGQLATSSTVAIATGGTLDVQATFDAVRTANLLGGSIVGSGTLSASNTFALQSGTVSAHLVGSAGLVKSGIGGALVGGITTLSNSNSYTGSTQVTGGQLQIAAGSAGTLGSTTSALVVTGSGSLLMSNKGSFQPTSVVDLGRTTQHVGAVSIGNGGVVQNGTLIGTGYTVNGGGYVTASLGGAGGLTLNSGLLILGGANTYTGATQVAGGVLEVHAGGSLAAASNIAIGSGATALFDTAQTIGNNIALAGGTLGILTTGTTTVTGTLTAGSGTIVQGGTGTLIFMAPSHSLHVDAIGSVLFRGLDLNKIAGLWALPNVTLEDRSYYDPFHNKTVASSPLTYISGTAQNNYSLGSTDQQLIVTGSGAGVVVGSVAVKQGVLNIESGGVVSGGVTMTGGETIVNGVLGSGAWIGGHFTGLNDAIVGHGAYLHGNGTVGGNLINSGVVSPGNSPGTLHVGGNYVQNQSGVLLEDVASPTVYDRLLVKGSASLGGSLQINYFKGYTPSLDDKFTVLTANGGVSGTFNLVDPNATDSMLKLGLVYQPNQVLLEFVQGSFSGLTSQFQLTPNQRAVAQGLDEVAATQPRSALIMALDSLKVADVPAELEALSPSGLVSIFQIGVATEAVQSSNIQHRLQEIRNGGTGFSSNGANFTDMSGSFHIDNNETFYLYPDRQQQRTADAPVTSFDGLPLFGASDPKNQWTAAEIQARGPITALTNDRWGSFIAGSGEFTKVSNTDLVKGSDFSTGGVTVGLDYRVSSDFAVGLMAGYANTSSGAAANGAVDVSGAKGGVYATWFNQGFYADGSAVIGGNNYDTTRSTIGGTAHGSTSGLNCNVLLGGGFDTKMGTLAFGPVMSAQYTNIGFDQFTETGSLAALSFPSQSEDSMRTQMGVHASYCFVLGKSTFLTPDLRLQWQHEFMDSTATLASRFAGQTSTFSVSGVPLSRDSVWVDAGAVLQVSPTVSVFSYYSGDLGRSQYSSNTISGGVRVDF